MRGVYLPGGRRVETREVADPTPGDGQVVLAMRASTICGSDLRAIYREHLGTGPEAYQGVIAGHEPCGEVVALGPGCRRLSLGDRVVVYHIAGCGQCADCRAGFFINCTSPLRAAYGWQRNGGHADLLCAEESTCIVLPDALDFVDGACIACGFGTAYEALVRAGISGRDALLVTGLGPVGLAAGLIARHMGAHTILGVEANPARQRLAKDLGAVDVVMGPDEDVAARVLDLTGGQGVDAALDASGAAAARATAVESTRRFGRCVFVGEGGRFDVDASHALIHRQLTLHGSWVTSIGRMAELTLLLARWGLRPSITVTDRFGLDGAADAYALADQGGAGKVAIIME
ncbi:MAG TPA: zinc-binding dehydrogenase [Acidimicrobiales bacterium]|nr:zinc-binding dehydrogenase [Acidimicrobiales bacterium]